LFERKYNFVIFFTRWLDRMTLFQQFWRQAVSVAASAYLVSAQDWLIREPGAALDIGEQ
jgi:hypothetical protein